MSPPEVFLKSVCDLVHFGNVRHILYYLKVNISLATIPPTSPTFPTVQLVIISVNT